MADDAEPSMMIANIDQPVCPILLSHGQSPWRRLFFLSLTHGKPWAHGTMFDFDPGGLHFLLILVESVRTDDPGKNQHHASRREVPRVSQSRLIAVVLSLTMDDL